MKHTIETITTTLKKRNILDCKVIKLMGNKVLLRDVEYGDYLVDLKCFCPKGCISYHPDRKREKHRQESIERVKKLKLPNVEIVNVFHGHDRGYKNRSIYIEYRNECGHLGVSTEIYLKKHKKVGKCLSCHKLIHGMRKKIDNKILQRSPTYNFWVSNKSKFNMPFLEFYDKFGDKPFKNADLILINNNYTWINLGYSIEKSSIEDSITYHRHQFKFTDIYKNAVNIIKTPDGYKCPKCNNLYKKHDIQVDHIESIKPISGEKLDLDSYISRIYTENVQAICKKCHKQKTYSENSIRAKNKAILRKKKS